MYHTWEESAQLKDDAKSKFGSEVYLLKLEDISNLRPQRWPSRTFLIQKLCLGPGFAKLQTVSVFILLRKQKLSPPQ